MVKRKRPALLNNRRQFTTPLYSRLYSTTSCSNCSGDEKEKSTPRLVVPSSSSSSSKARKANHTKSVRTLNDSDDDDKEDDDAKSRVLRDSELIAFRARLEAIIDNNEEFKLIYTKILDSLTIKKNNNNVEKSITISNDNFTLSIDKTANSEISNELRVSTAAATTLSQEQRENLKKKLKFKLSHIITCLRKIFAIKYSINMTPKNSTTSNDFGSLSDSMVAKRLNAEYQVALLSKLYKVNRIQLMRVFYKISDVTNENAGDEACEVLLSTNEKDIENLELDFEAMGILNDMLPGLNHLDEEDDHLDDIDNSDDLESYDDCEFSLFNNDADYLYLPATLAEDDDEQIKDDFYPRNLLLEYPSLTEISKNFPNLRENRFDVMVQEYSRTLKSRLDIDYIEDVEALMEAEIEEAVDDLKTHIPKIDQFVLKLRQLVLKEMLLAF